MSDDAPRLASDGVISVRFERDIRRLRYRCNLAPLPGSEHDRAPVDDKVHREDLRASTCTGRESAYSSSAKELPALMSRELGGATLGRDSHARNPTDRRALLAHSAPNRTLIAMKLTRIQLTAHP